MKFKINREKEEGKTCKETYLSSVLKANAEKKDGSVLKHIMKSL